MKKDDAISQLGADLGVFFAGLYTCSAAIYFLTNEKLALFIYFIMSVYMFAGPLSMVFFMLFKDFSNEQFKNIMNDSIMRSSVINKEFILNYLILSIGYLLPFIFDGSNITKIWASICSVLTSYMLYKMFDINKKLTNEQNQLEIKTIK